jgi:hypothetical protein
MPRIICPECDESVRVPRDYERRTIRCPSCDFRIPLDEDDDDDLEPPPSRARAAKGVLTKQSASPTRSALLGNVVPVLAMGAIGIFLILLIFVLPGPGSIMAGLYIVYGVPGISTYMGILRAKQNHHYVDIDYLSFLGWVRWLFIIGFCGLYLLIWLVIYYVVQIKVAVSKPVVMLPWVLWPVHSIILSIALVIVINIHQAAVAPPQVAQNFPPPQPIAPPPPPKERPKFNKPGAIKPPAEKQPDKEEPARPKPNFEIKDEAPFRYVAELAEFDVKPGPWPFANNGATGDPKGVPITIDGVPSPKGLGMHPPLSGAASAKFKLGKNATMFKSFYGLNDTSRPLSGVVFEVLGDGKSLWKSDIVNKVREPKYCVADLANVDVMELRVQCLGIHTGMHAVWIEPRVVLKNRE